MVAISATSDDGPSENEIVDSLGPMAVGWRSALAASSPSEHCKLDDDVLAVSESIVTSETINIQFTSGTTGMPKAVALTHRNLVNNGTADKLMLTVLI